MKASDPEGGKKDFSEGAASYRGRHLGTKTANGGYVSDLIKLDAAAKMLTVSRRTIARLIAHKGNCLSCAFQSAATPFPSQRLTPTLPPTR
jgi:hypothetical protein